MVDVLIVAKSDWSNVGFSFAKALQTVGVNARAIKAFPHKFDYPEEAEVFPNVAAARPLFQQAKAVLFMHSHAGWRPPDFRFDKKFTAVFHGGTPYRRNPRGMNDLFNPKMDASIIQTADLLGLGAYNEHWVMPPIDTEAIPASRSLHKPLTIGHYPRSADAKGSDVVNRVVLGLKADEDIKTDFEYLHSDQQLAWRENINRMAETDIYVERQRYVNVDGKRVMEFGVTAIEAAALGCIVVSTFNSRGIYEDNFGPCPLIEANCEDDFRDRMRELLTAHPNKLRAIKRQMRAWVEKCHSYEAVGERLKQVFSPVLN